MTQGAHSYRRLNRAQLNLGQRGIGNIFQDLDAFQIRMSLHLFILESTQNFNEEVPLQGLPLNIYHLNLYHNSIQQDHCDLISCFCIEHEFHKKI